MVLAMIRRAALALVLAACRTSQPSSVSEARPAESPPPASSVTSPDADHDHAGEHHHGKQGYHMDFSEVERFARHFDSPERDSWQKPSEVVSLLDLRPGHVVADIGAGTGYFLSHLSKAAGNRGRVLALDVEPNMVLYMNRRVRQSGWTNVEPRVVAPDDPNLPADGVDRILIVDTWHHIDDRAVYAAKLVRALRARGLVLIVDFTPESDLGPPAKHRLPPEQVNKELEGGGFRAEIVRSESLPKQYVVRGAKP
jgi:cyclopropane fatty-acyl-phospholipid synthase-like methyltransferase